MIRLSLPLPPSVNNMYATCGKKRVRSQTYNTWRENAGWKIVLAKQVPIVGRVCVHLIVRFPTKQRADLDNRAKPVLDLLVHHHLIEDDQHVYGLAMLRQDTPGSSGVDVRVTPWVAP